MKFVIRADASVSIGTGHIMRCLTLARALRERGATVFFVCRELPGNCCDIVIENGYSVVRLAGHEPFVADLDAEQMIMAMLDRPDWLVVDHYHISETWEQHLRPHVGRIMVIDDLADRRHDCDALLDQNLFDDMLVRYDDLTPPSCRLFLGPRYALLRDEFIAARRTLGERCGIVRRILLFFGGTDPTNETEKALQALSEKEFSSMTLDVVVGTANPNGTRISDICTTMPNVTFHRQVSNMAELIAHADLAVGAGGTTTWERCFLGLPTLTVVVADNQARPTEAAAKAGLAYFAGTSDELDVPSLARALRQAVSRPDALKNMAGQCLSFMGERETPVHDEILDSLFEVTDAP